jgi:hypothetical protein
MAMFPGYSSVVLPYGLPNQHVNIDVIPFRSSFEKHHQLEPQKQSASAVRGIEATARSIMVRYHLHHSISSLFSKASAEFSVP